MARAKKADTDTVEPVATQERMYEAQPGQVAVRNMTDHGILLLDKSRRASWTELPSVVCPPGIPVLVPSHLFAWKSEGARLLDTGELETVEDQRGVIAGWIDAQHSHDVAEARDGVRPGPNRQQKIEHWKGIVVDRSLAEVIVNCLDAGVPEDTAVTILSRIYDESFIKQIASSRPWIEASQELIAQLAQESEVNGHGKVRQAEASPEPQDPGNGDADERPNEDGSS